MKICKICNAAFENSKIYANHIRWKHREKFSRIGIDEFRKKRRENEAKKHGGFFIECSIPCSKCGNTFSIRKRENKPLRKTRYFCSQKCANSRNFSQESSLKRKKSNSISSKRLWQDKDYVAKMLSRSPIYNSKGEIEMRNHFINSFEEDKWTYGMIAKNLSVDLFSKVQQVVVEYDGVWHFKDIHGQLERKQKKDLMLEKWCLNNGYRLIRIKEEIYKSDKMSALSRIEEAIYKSKDQIIKFY